MAAQKGSAMLLKIGDGGSPATFSVVGGMRSNDITFNNEMVDITSADDASKWRQLLADAGIKSASLSGSGVFKDDAQDGTIREVFFAGGIRQWQITIPGFQTLEGNFQITSLQYQAEHNGEVTYSITLESAGEIFNTAI